MRRQLSYRLALEECESRRLLSGDVGVIWGADAWLTLSFAPDGTPVGNETSNLLAQMDAVAPRHEWQDAILRGFQTWAIETNSNIGLVGDSGDPFGVEGSFRQDPRFGDIRIGSIPMGDPNNGGNYAVAVSAAETVDGTWVGEVLFNSQAQFANADEIYRVALHEAGHVFGLDDNGDPNSPMHSHGIPPANIAPTQQDIDALHAFYGARSPDVYDLDGGGPVDLRDFEDAHGLDGGAPTIVFGDISSPADVDTYLLEVTEGYSGPITVELVTSGISQLAHRIKVIEPDGTEHFASGDAGQDSVIPGPSETLVGQGDQVFRIEVQTSSSVLNNAIGGYTLVVWYDNLSTVQWADIQELIRVPIRLIDQKEIEDYFEDGALFANDDLGTNDLPGSETELESIPGFVEGTRYLATASIETLGDIDRYVFEAVDNTNNANLFARLALRSLNPNVVTPAVEIYDDAQNLIAMETLVSNDDVVISQFPVSADTDYFLKVNANEAQPFATGSYEIDIVVSPGNVTREVFTTQDLRNQNAAHTHALRIYSPSIVQLGLEVEGVVGNVALELSILDRQGNQVARIDVRNGETRTVSTLLPRGGYRVVVGAKAGSAAFQNLNYTLFGAVVDRPLGPQYHDPTEEPFRFLETRIQLAIAGIFH